MRCPICKKPLADPLAEAGGAPAGSPFPFCSERCRLIDLGRWLSGTYQIPVAPEDEDESSPADGEPSQER